MTDITDSATNQQRNGNFMMLCAAAFLVSASVFIWWLALPYISKKIGGSYIYVGFCFSGNMGCYLLTCAVTASFLDRLKPKLTVICAVISQIILLTAIMSLVLWQQEISGFFNPAYLLVIISSLAGIGVAFFWPPLMGWISTSHEGAALNRRLGIFNAHWSLAGVIASLAAGYLVEINHALSFGVAVALLCLAVVVLSFTRCSSKVIIKEQHTEYANTLYKGNSRFRWMARVALLTAFTCMGLIRCYVPLLFESKLGFSVSSYGIFAMFISGANFLMLSILGRTGRWHHKTGLYALAHIPFAASLAIILFCRQLIVFYVTAVLIGAAVGFIYSSHLFYGVSGGKKRSALMAIHEGTLSMGFIIGALAGGYLSDTFGEYMPYWFGLAAITTGAITELVIYFALKDAKDQALPLATSMRNASASH